MDESEAVNLQIVQEASQNTEEPFSVLDPSATTLDEMALTESVSPPAEDANMAQQPNPEETELPVQVEAPLPHAADEEAESADIPEKSALEKIMDALKNSVNELSTAALARDEVHQLETMVMDIKRELYGAEFRGRN